MFVKVENFPKKGLKCKSCYFPRLTELDFLNLNGEITYVGLNYFILEVENGSKLIIKYNYYNLVKDKFYEP